MGRYTIQRKSDVIKEVKSLEEMTNRKKEEDAKRRKKREEELQALADTVREADTKYPLAPPEVISYAPKEQKKYIVSAHNYYQ